MVGATGVAAAAGVLPAAPPMNPKPLLGVEAGGLAAGAVGVAAGVLDFMDSPPNMPLPPPFKPCRSFVPPVLLLPPLLPLRGVLLLLLLLLPAGRSKKPPPIGSCSSGVECETCDGKICASERKKEERANKDKLDLK